MPGGEVSARHASASQAVLSRCPKRRQAVGESGRATGRSIVPYIPANNVTSSMPI
jgi:hypothetical protein